MESFNATVTVLDHGFQCGDKIIVADETVYVVSRVIDTNRLLLSHPTLIRRLIWFMDRVRRRAIRMWWRLIDP